MFMSILTYIVTPSFSILHCLAGLGAVLLLYEIIPRQGRVLNSGLRNAADTVLSTLIVLVVLAFFATISYSLACVDRMYIELLKLAFHPFGAAVETSVWVAVIHGLVILHFMAFLTHRCFLHPLAGVPGRRLAAVTSLYGRWRWGTIGQGRYAKKMRSLHEHYGE